MSPTLSRRHRNVLRNARESRSTYAKAELAAAGGAGTLLPSMSSWPRGAARRLRAAVESRYRLPFGTCQLVLTVGPGLPAALKVFSVTCTRAGLSPISSSSEPSALVSGFAPPCS
jgi:hypothetical protein